MSYSPESNIPASLLINRRITDAFLQRKTPHPPCRTVVRGVPADPRVLGAWARTFVLSILLHKQIVHISSIIKMIRVYINRWGWY